MKKEMKTRTPDSPPTEPGLYVPGISEGLRHSVTSALQWMSSVSATQDTLDDLIGRVVRSPAIRSAIESAVFAELYAMFQQVGTTHRTPPRDLPSPLTPPLTPPLSPDATPHATPGTSPVHRNAPRWELHMSDLLAYAYLALAPDRERSIGDIRQRLPAATGTFDWDASSHVIFAVATEHGWTTSECVLFTLFFVTPVLPTFLGSTPNDIKAVWLRQETTAMPTGFASYCPSPGMPAKFRMLLSVLDRVYADVARASKVTPTSISRMCSGVRVKLVTARAVLAALHLPSSRTIAEVLDIVPTRSLTQKVAPHE